MIHIFDLLGSYCGMHYYDIAFADVLQQRGHRCLVHSNFEHKGVSEVYFPQFFSCNKILGLLRFLCAYFRFFGFVLTHQNEKIVYLTYGELYELPFLYALALSKNGWVDVHEIHALKYKDDSKVSKMFEGLYKKRIHHVIYHSQRTYDILKNDSLDMVYVPHFKYVFQRTYDEKNISEDIKKSFCSTLSKFLFFGNLSIVKGIDTVIDVFKKIDKTNDFELVIAGKNVENIDFSSLKSEKIRIFDRHINDDELVYLYSKTDYILLPYKKSSQSGIFAMAAYFHKAMILSDIPYFESMIQKFPSFGFISSLAKYEECVESVIANRKQNYYSQEDCDRFEMKKEIDNFVNNFTKRK